MADFPDWGMRRRLGIELNRQALIDATARFDGEREALAYAMCQTPTEEVHGPDGPMLVRMDINDARRVADAVLAAGWRRVEVHDA